MGLPLCHRASFLLHQASLRGPQTLQDWASWAISGDKEDREPSQHRSLREWGNQERALWMSLTIGLQVYEGLKQQSGGMKEAAGTCRDHYDISSGTEGTKYVHRLRLTHAYIKNDEVQLLNSQSLSVPNTSRVTAPIGAALPSRSCRRLCCFIWFREGRAWLAAATVSFVQSSTSLWRSSVNVPLLLLLLLVWTWARRVNGWGEGEDVAAESDGWVWLEAVWAVVVLREDPEKTQRS